MKTLNVFKKIRNIIVGNTKPSDDALWIDTSEGESKAVIKYKGSPILPNKNTAVKTFITNIAAIPSEILTQATAGDIIVKQTGTQNHAYRVSYKEFYDNDGTMVGGICLTYVDCENVETVSYDYNASTNSWDYNSTDITHIGG